MKRRTRVLPALEEIAALRFDDDAVRAECRASVLARKIRGQPLPVQRSLDGNAFEDVWLALEMPKGSGNRNVGRQRFQLIPTIQPAMGFHGEFQQVIHVAGFH